MVLKGGVKGVMGGHDVPGVLLHRWRGIVGYPLGGLMGGCAAAADRATCGVGRTEQRAVVPPLEWFIGGLMGGCGGVGGVGTGGGGL